MPLAAPVTASPADPRSIEGFSIAATVIYADVAGKRSTQRLSSMPSEIRKPRDEVAKRLSAVTLVRNDGTACYQQLDASLRPPVNGALAGGPGSRLSNLGAELVIEAITQDGIDVRMTRMFPPYVVATRTQLENY